MKSRAAVAFAAGEPLKIVEIDVEPPRKGEVLVIRRSGTPQPVVIPLDLEAAISGTDTSQDILLQPYDIVYVPRTAIAEVNQFIDQYFRQNIPIPFGVGYGLNN